MGLTMEILFSFIYNMPINNGKKRTFETIFRKKYHGEYFCSYCARNCRVVYWTFWCLTDGVVFHVITFGRNAHFRQFSINYVYFWRVGIVSPMQRSTLRLIIIHITEQSCTLTRIIHIVIVHQELNVQYTYIQMPIHYRQPYL